MYCAPSVATSLPRAPPERRRHREPVVKRIHGVVAGSQAQRAHRHRDCARPSDWPPHLARFDESYISVIDCHPTSVPINRYWHSCYSGSGWTTPSSSMPPSWTPTSLASRWRSGAPRPSPLGALARAGTSIANFYNRHLRVPRWELHRNPGHQGVLPVRGHRDYQRLPHPDYIVYGSTSAFIQARGRSPPRLAVAVLRPRAWWYSTAPKPQAH